MLAFPDDHLRAAAGRAAQGELAVAGALRPQRLLGPDRVRPPRADRDRRDREIEIVAPGRAGGDAPAQLGRGAQTLRTRSLPGVARAQSPARSTSPDPWRTGSCRRASGCCVGGWRPTSGPTGTREFIKVLRLMERLRLARAAGAVERALGCGANTERRRGRPHPRHRTEPPVGLFSLDGHPHLQVRADRPTRPHAPTRR